jgi:hypothetical protein
MIVSVLGNSNCYWLKQFTSYVVGKRQFQRPEHPVHSTYGSVSDRLGNSCGQAKARKSHEMHGGGTCTSKKIFIM